MAQVTNKKISYHEITCDCGGLISSQEESESEMQIKPYGMSMTVRPVNTPTCKCCGRQFQVKFDMNNFTIMVEETRGPIK